PPAWLEDGESLQSRRLHGRRCSLWNAGRELDLTGDWGRSSAWSRCRGDGREPLGPADRLQVEVLTLPGNDAQGSDPALLRLASRHRAISTSPARKDGRREIESSRVYDNAGGVPSQTNERRRLATG